MDALKQIAKRPSFKLGRKLCNDPSVVNERNIKLTPAQRIFVRNFSEEGDQGKGLFRGDPEEKCHYPGCGTLLSVYNRYIYCQSCLSRYSEDFIESKPLLNLAHAWEKLRRDRQPNKQVRRKRA